MPEAEKYIIIICSEKLTHRELVAGFEATGFSTLIIDKSNQDIIDNIIHPPKAIILDAREIGLKPQSLQKIQDKFQSTLIPVLALIEELPVSENEQFSSVLIAPHPPAQIILRTSALIRLSEMQTELGLRVQTLEQSFGEEFHGFEADTLDPFNILFIGKASPEFMVIVNALQKKNVNVIAAFTSFTAFDYLYEKKFDAVVINGLHDMEPAMSVAQTMRKNAKLYHVPALLLVDGDSFNYDETAYNSGFDDVVDAKSDLMEISSRILERANFYRLHDQLKDQFGTLGGDKCTDKTTKLFNKAFFNAHILRLNRYYQSLGQPISLCLIRVLPNNPDAKTDISASYTQIGSLLKNLVRVQDLIARLETNMFAIIFPGQDSKELKSVENRLNSILKCAILSDPITKNPIDIKLEIRMTSLNECEKEKTQKTSVA